MPRHTARPYVRVDQVADKLHITVCQVVNRNLIPYERFVVDVNDVESLTMELERVYAKLRGPARSEVK